MGKLVHLHCGRKGGTQNQYFKSGYLSIFVFSSLTSIGWTLDNCPPHIAEIGLTVPGVCLLYHVKRPVLLYHHCSQPTRYTFEWIAQSRSSLIGVCFPLLSFLESWSIDASSSRPLWTRNCIICTTSSSEPFSSYVAQLAHGSSALPERTRRQHNYRVHRRSDYDFRWCSGVRERSLDSQWSYNERGRLVPADIQEGKLIL